MKLAAVEGSQCMKLVDVMITIYKSLCTPAMCSIVATHMNKLQLNFCFMFCPHSGLHMGRGKGGWGEGVCWQHTDLEVVLSSMSR